MNETAAALITIGGALAVLGGWWRWVRPKIRRVSSDAVAMRDTLVGRDAVYDTITGKEIAPAIPGVGVRMAHQEKRMDDLTDAFKTLAEAQVEIARHSGVLADHEDRIDSLELAQQERIAARIETAQAWKAMEAAHNADPDEDAAG